MITLIPAAGNGERFRQAGYPQPKPLLPMPDGRTLIEWVVDSLSARRLVLCVRAEQADAVRYKAAIRSNKLRQRPPQAVILRHESAGPLATILEAAVEVGYQGLQDELLISYCDCFLADGVTPFVTAARESGLEAAMVVFQDASDRFTDAPRQPGYKVGGIFWFRNEADFYRRAKMLALSDSMGAPAVVYSYDDWLPWDGTGQYVDLGIPADYEAFLASYEGVA